MATVFKITMSADCVCHVTQQTVDMEETFAACVDKLLIKRRREGERENNGGLRARRMMRSRRRGAGRRANTKTEPVGGTCELEMR